MLLLSVDHFTYNSDKFLQPEKAPSAIDWILLNDMSLSKKERSYSNVNHDKTGIKQNMHKFTQYKTAVKNWN